MDDVRRNLPSGSSFAADYECSGRQNLLRSMREQSIPETTEPELTEMADRGTRIHAARSMGQTFDLKEDELIAYQKGLELEQQLTDQWRLDIGIEQLPEPILEERMWLHHPIHLSPLLSGQTDVVYVSKPFALIADWKSGFATYVPPSNQAWQLRVYALLLWKNHDGVDHIRVAFIKPGAFGERLDYTDFNLFDLEQIESAVLHAIWKSQQADAKLNAGSHCRFCDARGVCPEAAKYAMVPAIQYGTNLTETLERVKVMSPEDALKVWRRKNEITKIIEAITVRLAGLPPEELERLGLKFRLGKKTDKIVDVVGAFDSLLNAGVDRDTLLKSMSFSKERLISAIQDFKNCRESYAETFYENQLDEFIQRGRGKPTLEL